jgi:uncharacterized protein YqeY
MSQLSERIDNDFKEAMKARDKKRTGAIRLIRADLQRRAKEKREELTDEEVVGALVSQAKQRKDSIEQFTEGGRQDLADIEIAELAVINGYLPEQMGEDEVRKIVSETIAATGATGPKEMGKVMGALMPKVKGKADGKLVNQLVRELLGQ